MPGQVQAPTPTLPQIWGRVQDRDMRAKQRTSAAFSPLPGFGRGVRGEGRILCTKRQLDGKRIRTTAAIQRRARELRHEMTPAETMLWTRLRRKDLHGFKFRRQHPLGPFIVDFCCPVHRLIVELDGPIHDRQTQHDAARTEQLEQFGYRVIRFRNEEVLSDVERIVFEISQACKC